jgi:hypothetical protein
MPADGPTPLPDSVLTGVPSATPYESALLDLVDAICATLCDELPSAVLTLAGHIRDRAHAVAAAGGATGVRTAVLTVAVDRMARRMGVGVAPELPPPPAGPVVDLGAYRAAVAARRGVAPSPGSGAA